MKQVILFPKKPVLPQSVLKTLPKKQLDAYKRYSIILKADPENPNKAFLQVAGCNPFDRFERAKGREIAESKEPFVLLKTDDDDWKDIINFIEMVASNGAPLVEILKIEAKKDGIVHLVRTEL